MVDRDALRRDVTSLIEEECRSPKPCPDYLGWLREVLDKADDAAADLAEDAERVAYFTRAQPL